MSRLRTYHRACENKARAAKKKYDAVEDKLFRQKDKVRALETRLNFERAEMIQLHTRRAQLLELMSNYASVAVSLKEILKDI